MNYFQGIPAFASYFGMGLGFLAAFLLVYVALTPHHELRLIRAGNQAASVTLAGVVLGYSIPLASALRYSIGAGDLALWAVVAVLAQLSAYILVRMLLPSFSKRIEAGEMSAAILSFSLHIAVGLFNASAMTY